MSRTFLNVLIVTTVCLSWYNGLGSAVKIDITPNKAHRLVHHEVDIYCKLEESDSDIKDVIIMELVKGDVPIAVIRHNSKLAIGRGMRSKFKADGKLSASPIHSYLHVTLSNPDIDDSGSYTCVFYFKGERTQIKESRTSADLTVFGSALNLDITPSKANGLVQHEVTIHCNMEYSGTDVTQIKMMELTRDGEPIAVIHNNSKITMGKDTESTFQAKGKLSAPPMESYLHLTLSNPDAKDSGRYTCLVYYVDEMSRVKESSKSDNLTVVDHDVESAIIIMGNTMTRQNERHDSDIDQLEKDLDSQKNKSTANRNLISGLKTELNAKSSIHKSDVSQLKKELERRRNESMVISSLKTELNSQRSTHERDLYQLKNELGRQVNESLNGQALISELKTQLKDMKRAHQIDIIRLKKELIRKEDGMRADQRAISNIKEKVDALKEGHKKDAVQLLHEINVQGGKTTQNQIRISTLKTLLSAKIRVVNVDADELDRNLDKQGNVLTVREKSLEERITTQLSDRIKGNNIDSEEQNRTLNEIKTTDSTLRNKVLQLRHKTLAQSQRIDDVFDQESKTVLFRALHSTSWTGETFLENKTMVYSDVKVNEGGGYNGTTGIFTAPFTGYYLLSVSVSADDTFFIYVNLQSNKGYTLTTLYSGEKNGWLEYSDTSVVVKLDAGEEITPVIREISSGFAIRNEGLNDAMNKFNGYLLKTVK